MADDVDEEEDKYIVPAPDPNLATDGPNTRLQDRKAALRQVRDAIAALQATPATALDGDKHALLEDADDDLRSLERALTNEVDQLREKGSTE